MQAVQVTPETRRGRNQLAATVVVGHAIKHIYLAALSAILLPEIKLGMGLSATQLGSLAFSRQVTGWVTTMGAGYLGDRFANHASLFLALSFVFMGLSYFLAGSAATYWVMFVAMFLVGVGPSLYHSPAVSTLSRRFPDRRGLAISLHGAGGSTGEVLGPLTGAGLLVLLTWQKALQASFLPALVVAFLLWAVMRSVPAGGDSGSPSARAYFASLATLLKKPVLFILVVVTALRSMGMSTANTFLPVYLREDLAFSPGHVAVYMSLAQVMGIGAAPLMGFLSDRFGRKAVLVPAMATMGLAFFALAFAPAGWQLLASVLLLGTVLYSLNAILIAAALDVAGSQVQATVVSLVYGASILGVLSPVVAGVIADARGIPTAFMYGGAMVLLGTTILGAVKLPRTATQAAKGGH